MAISILGLTLLGVKDATWKLKRKLSFELSDERIIQRSDGAAAIEIPLNNIESLHEYRGLLLVKGGEPRQQMSVPREINDFEVLKRELTSYHPITVFKAKVNPFSYLPVILIIVAWFLLLTSHARPVVLVAGIAALGLQAAGGTRYYVRFVASRIQSLSCQYLFSRGCSLQLSFSSESNLCCEI